MSSGNRLFWGGMAVILVIAMALAIDKSKAEQRTKAEQTRQENLVEAKSGLNFLIQYATDPALPSIERDPTWICWSMEQSLQKANATVGDLGISKETFSKLMGKNMNLFADQFAELAKAEPKNTYFGNLPKTIESLRTDSRRWYGGTLTGCGVPSSL